MNWNIKVYEKVSKVLYSGVGCYTPRVKKILENGLANLKGEEKADLLIFISSHQKREQAKKTLLEALPLTKNKETRVRIYLRVSDRVDKPEEEYEWYQNIFKEYPEFYSKDDFRNIGGYLYLLKQLKKHDEIIEIWKKHKEVYDKTNKKESKDYYLMKIVSAYAPAFYEKGDYKIVKEILKEVEVAEKDKNKKEKYYDDEEIKKWQEKLKDK